MSDQEYPFYSELLRLYNEAITRHEMHFAQYNHIVEEYHQAILQLDDAWEVSNNIMMAQLRDTLSEWLRQLNDLMSASCHFYSCLKQLACR
jgi:hypothetical protein